MPKNDANAFLNIDLIPDEPLIATPLNRPQQPSTLQSSVPSCLERQKEEEKHELFSNRQNDAPYEEKSETPRSDIYMELMLEW